MLSDLLITAALLTVVALGMWRPHIALAGVMLVELVRPQELSTSFLAGQPLAMLLTLFLIGSFVIGFDYWRRPIRHTYPTLIILFMVWVTLSTTYAEFPERAWPMHAIVIKTLLVALLIPFAINTRVKVECVLWAYVASIAFFCVQGGMKTLAGGGGYGNDYLTTTAGGLLTESSTLATVSVATIPLLLWLGRRSMLATSYPPLRWLVYLIVFACGLTAIGTFARTGLVCAGVYMLYSFWESKHKARNLVAASIMVVAAASFVSENWISRMETLRAVNQDSSATGRLAVWRWTINYAAKHPFFGGGFEAYFANGGKLFDYIGADEVLGADGTTAEGKAFHSIIFQVLGEHGYGGLLIFLAVILTTLLNNRIMRRQVGLEDWHRELAHALAQTLTIFCVGGLFIGVAYIPVIWFLTAFSAGLGNVAAGIDYSAAAVGTAAQVSVGFVPRQGVVGT